MTTEPGKRLSASQFLELAQDKLGRWRDSSTKVASYEYVYWAEEFAYLTVNLGQCLMASESALSASQARAERAEKVLSFATSLLSEDKMKELATCYAIYPAYLEALADEGECSKSVEGKPCIANYIK